VETTLDIVSSGVGSWFAKVGSIPNAASNDFDYPSNTTSIFATRANRTIYLQVIGQSETLTQVNITTTGESVDFTSLTANAYNWISLFRYGVFFTFEATSNAKLRFGMDIDGPTSSTLWFGRGDQAWDSKLSPVGAIETNKIIEDKYYISIDNTYRGTYYGFIKPHSSCIMSACTVKFHISNHDQSITSPEGKVL
jgi:hypothetical protein